MNMCRSRLRLSSHYRSGARILARDYHGLMSRPFLISLFVILAVGCGARTSVHHDAGPTSDDVTYGAVGFPTGMSRFAVFKLDEPRDRCTVVGFVHPIDRPTPGVELPDRWTVEAAWRGESAMCSGIDYHAGDEVTLAAAISGVGHWEESMCEIDVDLTLEFENEDPERVVAENLALGWGGCED